MNEVINAATKSTCDQIELICSLEKNRAFTMNVQEFSISQEAHKLEYIHYRNDKNSPRRGVRATNTIRDQAGFFQSLSHNEVADELIMSQLTAKGIRVTDPKQLALLYPRDEYDSELDVISAVDAYFEIASKRLIDFMPMIFEVVFIQELVKRLRPALTLRLKLADDVEAAKTCQRYAREDDDIHEKRMKITAEREVLLESLEILQAS